jgi:hypothetical protein
MTKFLEVSGRITTFYRRKKEIPSDSGIIKLFENKLGHSMQWLILLAGPTTGPKVFSGPLGKALNKVEERSVVAFRPIESKMPLMTIAS